MNRGKLRELLKEVTHLTEINCHTEARLKIAVTFDLFDVARLLLALESIQSIEKNLPRSLLMYRDHLTNRVLRHVKERHGDLIMNKILESITISEA
jgi:hypothetical protein